MCKNKQEMNKKKVLLVALVSVAALVLVGGSTAMYFYYMPHRDVQATRPDATITTTELVKAFLENTQKANEHYLDAEGESQVLIVSGTVAEVSEDFEGNTVVLLKAEADPAGVSCTFLPETNQEAQQLAIGKQARIKGVIRAGAAYDPDLEMYEHVILEKCGLSDE